MNIFYLDTDLTKCAEAYVDRHIVKIPLEIAQMLCTARNLAGQSTKYRSTHINHPMNIWVRQSRKNYVWTCELGLALCEEYSYRYNKVHACQAVIQNCLENIPDFDLLDETTMPQCMPEECQVIDNPVEAYRRYYNIHKRHLFAWKNRLAPDWIIEYAYAR